MLFSVIFSHLIMIKTLAIKLRGLLGKDKVALMRRVGWKTPYDHFHRTILENHGIFFGPKKKIVGLTLVGFRFPLLA